MPPPTGLPPSVLAAIGLALGGCSITKACLSIDPPEDTSGTGDTGDTGDTPTTPAPESTASREVILERLATEGRLPPDVVERLRR